MLREYCALIEISGLFTKIFRVTTHTKSSARKKSVLKIQKKFPGRSIKLLNIWLHDHNVG